MIRKVLAAGLLTGVALAGAATAAADPDPAAPVVDAQAQHGGWLPQAALDILAALLGCFRLGRLGCHDRCRCRLGAAAFGDDGFSNAKPYARGEEPKRDYKPRDRDEAPKRDFKPRADGPKREFKPVDTYAVAGYLAYSFASAFRTEPALTYVRDQLGPDYLKIFDLDWKPEGALAARARLGR